MDTFSQTSSRVVAYESQTNRLSFYRKTFLHLAGAIVIFAALCALILSTPIGALVAGIFFSNTITTLIFFALFVGASYLAQNWAQGSTSLPMQYLGFGLYIVIEALIFTPLLLYVQFLGNTSIIGYAGISTITLAAGLIVLTMVNKIDFSFLDMFMAVASIAIFGIIIGALIFGLSLGVWFSAFMIGFASLAILRSASAVQNEFRSDQYVAASMSLFASIALLFYYILRLFGGRE